MTPITKPADLVGRTIASATYMKKPQWDDRPFLRLRFTDGAECYLSGGYGGFTGSSEDEYPMFITIAHGERFERDDLPHLVEDIEVA